MKYCAHDYQAYATDFVLSHPYCGLILDMGLGKSVITLTALWDLLLDSFDRLQKELPLGYALFHLPWVLEWYKATRQYKKACELLEAYFPGRTP